MMRGVVINMNDIGKRQLGADFIGQHLKPLDKPFFLRIFFYVLSMYSDRIVLTNDRVDEEAGLTKPKHLIGKFTSCWV